jgi:tripartite-type tricarboxylate transporter receptor subunit TctC
MKTLLGYALLAVVGLGAAGIGANAESYPTRPVTFVVPFAPGGGTEFLARMLGQRLEHRLGKPFVIENRAGGGGVIGALSVARAAADGYTILMAPSPVMAINVALHKKLPYEPAADFVPLALVVATPYVLVVTPSLPAQSVADLVTLAKAKPGQLAFASAGLGTPHHLFAQLFKSSTGIEMTHVPYRGSVPALTDVAAGHVQLMFCDIPPALGLIREGKVRALGVSTKERVAALPIFRPLPSRA